MTDFIPVNRPDLSGRERELVLECIDTGWISSEGPFISQFEEVFATRVQRKHGIAVANGSAALDIAVAALGIGQGDEVIIPSFTIISCANAVIRAGATPVFVDSDPVTWNMDIGQVERAITPHTKAIMVVHIYGLPVDMDPLLALAKKHGLLVIEDAAEMHGQNYKDRPCGSFGDISTFSFYPNKHITTGEGGMLVTDDTSVAERCKSLRNLCFQPKKRFVHEEMGWNYRMTNLQAALGIAQLERLDAQIARKRAMGKRYLELLGSLEGIELQPARMNYAENIYWVFGIVLSETVPCDADTIMAKLGERKIGTRPFFWPMHEQPVFHKMKWHKDQHLPVAERLARRGFYLPSGLGNTDEEFTRAAEALCQVVVHARKAA